MVISQGEMLLVEWQNSRLMSVRCVALFFIFSADLKSTRIFFMCRHAYTYRPTT